MTTDARLVFDELLEQLADQPESARFKQVLAKLDDAEAIDAERWLEDYQAAADSVEQVLWRKGCPEDLLALYQRLYREMELRLAQSGPDPRYQFTVVIPVADRPLHLQHCLGSLLTLCRCFTYGGLTTQGYTKVHVLIADDSRDPVNIRRHQELADEFSHQGLDTRHFGQTEQLQQLQRLSISQRQALASILGETDPREFYHKGASITRNLAYLKLAEQVRDDRRQLFWFMDSDQEFCVNIPERQQPVYALNYLQRISQIFADTDTQVLTGKVVGDPPVSPAVMAGNFLADVHAFLNEMAGLAPGGPCSFHGRDKPAADDAAYHDMADLFGFKPAATARYACCVSESHDHARCFVDFAARLSRFFDGEHPTRQTHYINNDLRDGIKPARTVYTGNYVLSAEALQYFIPFATLKLRMAGPVLGRMLQRSLGRRFVSANLPLLHKRTVDDIGQSECRPGLDRSEHQVDLSGEFERQFFGDVMLFTVERLCRDGYPIEPITEAAIQDTLQEIETALRQKYIAKRVQIEVRLEQLQAMFAQSGHWWHQDLTCISALHDFQHFFRNMEFNFGANSPAYHLIHSAAHRQQRLQEIRSAILRLPQDRSEWLDALRLGSRSRPDSR